MVVIILDRKLPNIQLRQLNQSIIEFSGVLGLLSRYRTFLAKISTFPKLALSSFHGSTTNHVTQCALK